MGWLPREKGNSAAGPRPTLTAATSGFSTQMCNISKKNISTHCEFGGHFPHHRYPFCQHFDGEPTAATSGFSTQMCNTSKNIVSLGVFFISIILTKVQNLLPCTTRG